MQVNALPRYDPSDNPTGCCPRFHPEGWDGQVLRFEDKPFVKARTRSFLHLPLNMRGVFNSTLRAIEAAGAHSEDDFVVLSRDESPWSAEHLFSVTGQVAGRETVRLSGDYRTRVFEGPYRLMPAWQAQMQRTAAEHDEVLKRTYFFYTTCPKCARTYGKNYVVAVAEVAARH